MWNIYSSEFALNAPLWCVFLSLLMGLILAVFYMKSGSFSKQLAMTIVVIPVLVQVIIMLVNGNIGTSVATLGAFSLVRFRSLPGNAREIGFILFAMAIGLINGMGFLLLSMLLTPLLGFLLLILGRTSFGDPAENERWLRMTVPEDLNDTTAFDSVFERYAKKVNLERIRTTNMGTLFEFSYMLHLKANINEKSFIDELRCRNGNLSIILERSPKDQPLL